MSDSDPRDYLHEELQRGIQEMEYEKYRVLVRQRRRQLQRRVIALLLAYQVWAWAHI